MKKQQVGLFFAALAAAPFGAPGIRSEAGVKRWLLAQGAGVPHDA